MFQTTNQHRFFTDFNESEGLWCMLVNLGGFWSTQHFLNPTWKRRQLRHDKSTVILHSFQSADPIIRWRQSQENSNYLSEFCLHNFWVCDVCVWCKAWLHMVHFALGCFLDGCHLHWFTLICCLKPFRRASPAQGPRGSARPAHPGKGHVPGQCSLEGDLRRVRAKWCKKLSNIQSQLSSIWPK